MYPTNNDAALTHWAANIHVSDRGEYSDTETSPTASKISAHVVTLYRTPIERKRLTLIKDKPLRSFHTLRQIVYSSAQRIEK